MSAKLPVCGNIQPPTYSYYKATSQHSARSKIKRLLFLKSFDD